jgi:hypothetical protein
VRVIAEVNTQQQPVAIDDQGNQVNVTGSLITLSEEQTLMVNIPVNLGEGQNLDSFTDSAGLTFENNTLEIPGSSTGGFLLNVTDDADSLETSLIINTGDCVGTGDEARAEVKSIKSSSGYTSKDLSEEDPSVGEVSSTIGLNLATLPQNASVKIVTSREPDPEADSAFKLAASGAGAESYNIAYTINIEKTNLVNDQDILDATITMVVGKDWVEANGGIENVSIIRYDPESGTNQVLETRFAGYDSQGRAIFTALSPDGLSIFGLVVLNSKPAVSPAGSPLATSPASVPGSSAAEPFNGWLIVLIIVIAVIIIFLIIRRRKTGKVNSNK